MTLTDAAVPSGFRAGWRTRLAHSPRATAVRLLAVVVAATLGVDAYVHASDAWFFEPPGGGLITQGHIFYVETAVASLAAAALLVRPRFEVWLVALLVSASALGAVLLYRYVDVGAIGPIPNMYDPTWREPGKVLSAIAEASAALLAAVGLVLTRRTG